MQFGHGACGPQINGLTHADIDENGQPKTDEWKVAGTFQVHCRDQSIVHLYVMSM